MRLIRLLLVLALLLAVLIGFCVVRGTKVEVACGPTVTTPPVVVGLDVAGKLGAALHDLATDGPTPLEVVVFVQRVMNLTRLLSDTFGAALNGRPAPKDAEGLRKAAREAQAAAVASCSCVTDDSKDQGGDTWDPKDAALVSLSSRFSSEQMSIARAAIGEAEKRSMPERAMVVILAAGFQESGVRNLDYGDRDSIGWLQQRNHYGSRAHRLNPAWAAGQFFDRLRRVDGWQQMTITQAAWRVQISAHPNGAARFEDDARALLRAAGGFQDALQAETPDCTPAPAVSGSGNTRHVTDPSSGKSYDIAIPAGPRGVAISFALDQLGEPYSHARNHGPDSWDCSGLVSAAWAKAGVRFTPQTGVLRHQVPTTSSPKPGDLAWKVGHVQMVIGHGLVVEAPRTGLRVRIARQMHATAYLDPTKVRGALV